MAKIKPVKYKEEIKHALTSVEIDQIRSVCSNEKERAIFEFLLSSGLRVSELCALNRTDVDFINLSVLVREGKGNKQRTTYISDICASRLKEYLETRTDNDPCMFLSKLGCRYKRGGIEFMLTELGKKSKVDNLHPHKLRRTFATNLAKKGMPIQNIKTLMGHSDINTTMTYINIATNIVKNEYERCS